MKKQIKKILIAVENNAERIALDCSRRDYHDYKMGMLKALKLVYDKMDKLKEKI